MLSGMGQASTGHTMNNTIDALAGSKMPIVMYRSNGDNVFFSKNGISFQPLFTISYAKNTLIDQNF